MPRVGLLQRYWGVGISVALLAALLAFYLSLPPPAGPAAPARGQPGACVLAPAQSILNLRACTRELTPGEAADRARAVDSTGRLATPGSRAGRWMSLTFFQPGTEPAVRMLYLGVPDAERLQVFQTTGTGQGSRALMALERDALFRDRPVLHPKLILPVTFSPGAHRIDIHYQLHANGRLQPQLFTDQDLHTRTTVGDVVNGALLGIMLTLFAVIVIYSLLVGQRAYWIYNALVFSEVAMLAQTEGYAFAFFWPESPAWNLSAPIYLGSVVMACHALFAVSFFQIQQRYPRLYRLHLAALGLLLGNLLLHLLQPLWPRFEFGMVLAVAYSVLALATGYRALRDHLPGTPLYLMGAASLLLFGFLLFMLGIRGLNPLPWVNFFDYPKFGLLFESLCFSAAMVNRVRLLREQQAELRVRRLAETQELLKAEDAKRSANARAEQKSLLLAAASHDISQPLASLRFAIEALRKRSDNEPIAKHLDNTLDYAQTLLRDIMAETRDDLQQQDDRVHLGELLALITQEHAAAAASNGLTLSYAPSHREIDAPALALRRILHNLVGNALRYTREGRVLVGVRWRAGGVELQVLDTGPGLLPSQIKTLQQPFERGDASVDGHGLGLFIVKSLCGQYGYELRIRSQLRRGSCFAVFIPLPAD